MYHIVYYCVPYRDEVLVDLMDMMYNWYIEKNLEQTIHQLDRLWVARVEERVV